MEWVKCECTRFSTKTLTWVLWNSVGVYFSLSVELGGHWKRGHGGWQHSWGSAVHCCRGPCYCERQDIYFKNYTKRRENKKRQNCSIYILSKNRQYFKLTKDFIININYIFLINKQTYTMLICTYSYKKILKSEIWSMKFIIIIINQLVNFFLPKNKLLNNIYQSSLAEFYYML